MSGPLATRATARGGGRGATRTLWRLLCALLLLSLPLAGCDESDASKKASAKPHVEIATGGFLFDRRSGDARYGFDAKVVRELPRGAELEATFDATKGPPIVVRHEYSPERGRYKFQTPPMRGVVEGREYKVVLRVHRSPGGPVLETHRMSYSANQGKRQR